MPKDQGIDPIELPRRNFIAPEAFPCQTPVAVKDNTGNHHATMDKAVDWGTVAHNFQHDTLETGLEETSFCDPANFAYPAGACICAVEADPATGQVDIQRFVAADDLGNVVNPMMVEGQVHGGIAQGLGQELLENCVYDENGQFVSASCRDDAMPRANDLPGFQIDHSSVTPSTRNPLGVNGRGEAGAIGSPPALVNAVIDALADLGVTHIDMPVSPGHVWAAIQAAK